MQILCGHMLLLFNAVTMAFAPAGWLASSSSLEGCLKAPDAFSRLSTPPERRSVHRPPSPPGPSCLSCRGGHTAPMNAGVLFKKLNTGAAVTEFLGTGALTLVVALVTSSLSTLSRGQQAVGVGAAVLTLILTGLKGSGANYNPVISLSLLLLGKITLGRGILYLCSQVAGALTGGALARALVGSAGRLRDPSFLLSPTVLCMESFFSFALVLLVLHASVSSGAQAHGRNQHFAGAIAVFVSVAAALGASMNPAVASGLFLSTGTSQGLGALWALPVLASIPAVGLYRLSDPDEAIALPSVPAFLSRLLPGGANGSLRIGAWREYMNEGVGTFLLTGTLLFASLTGAVPGPIAAGAMLFTLLLSTAHLSGTHLNPAVTLGLFVRKGRLDRRAWAHSLGYVFAQFLGAFLAAHVGRVACGPKLAGIAVPSLPLGVSPLQAFAAETLCTGALMQAIGIFRVNPTWPVMLSPLAIATALTACLMSASGLSGGGLNPAVVSALYLAKFSAKEWPNVWVYGLGPIVGSVLVGLADRFGVEKGGGAGEERVEGG